MALHLYVEFSSTASLAGLHMALSRENLFVQRKHFSEEPGVTTSLCLGVTYVVFPKQDGPTFLEKLVLE